MVRKMPFTVTNSCKRNSMMHTYGGQTRRVLGSDLPPASKRRRVESELSLGGRPWSEKDDVDAETNLLRAIRDSEAIVLQSAIKTNPTLATALSTRASISDTASASTAGPVFSEATALEESIKDDDDDDDLSTPPSSPPPLQLTPPSLAARKPTFSFLKKKREKTGAKHAKSSRVNAIQGEKEGARENSNGKRSSSPPARRKSKSDKDSAPSKSRGLKQMQLDLGQSTNIGQPCKECGMNYISSNAEDAAMHKRFHNEKLNVDGVDLGRAFIKANASRWIYEAARFDEGYVVIVDRKSSAAAKNQAMKVLEVVHQELGATEIDEGTLWSQVEMPEHLKKRKRDKGTEHPGDEEDPNDSLPTELNERADRFKVFLHMKESRCVGLCLAERIWESRIAERKGIANDSKPPIIDTSVSASSTVTPAIVGISRIWAAKSSRRKGIAMDLLDCVRSNYIYGMEIEKEQVAFSQPTESGCRLIDAFYADECQWHVYQES